jgi:succinate-semialdehyde dehydrogenase / glutarate-semialdehyde dehydrogenase
MSKFGEYAPAVTTTFPASVGLPESLSPDRRQALLRRLTCGADRAPAAVSAPFTGALLAEVPQAAPVEVAAAYARARAAQPDWAALDPARRSRILLRFHDLVLSRRSEVLDLIQAETGKARGDAYAEVADVALTARYYARRAPALLKPARHAGLLPVLTQVRELRHPKGVVAVISPWNYPLSLGAGDTLAALAAGNAVVQKPDNQTTLTACWAHALLHEAGLPEGLWHLVPGDPAEVGPPLLDGADFVMFTGSTAAGRRIAAAAAERLVGCSLELGGKNSAFVLADADLDRAVPGVLRGCFASAGQLCISSERVFVADEVYDEFVPRLAAAADALVLGAAFDWSADMGSLTSVARLNAVRAHLDDAVAKGATVLAGGRARPDVGPLFFAPTLLAGVTPQMRCHAEETFGPLAAVHRFGDLDDAIRTANDTPYGLNASVWTRDAAAGRAVAGRLRAGTVCVNDSFIPTWGSKDAPMGGMGDSGLGRRHGAEGLLKYTEAQTVAHQRLHPVAPVGPMGYATFAAALTLGLRVLRRTPRR